MPQFVGLKNDLHVAQDQRLVQALIVTFTFTLVSLLLNVILSFLISLRMNVKLSGIFFFRTCFYLLLMSGVVQAVPLSRLFDYTRNGGIIAVH